MLAERLDSAPPRRRRRRRRRRPGPAAARPTTRTRPATRASPTSARGCAIGSSKASALAASGRRSSTSTPATRSGRCRPTPTTPRSACRSARWLRTPGWPARPTSSSATTTATSPTCPSRSATAERRQLRARSGSVAAGAAVDRPTQHASSGADRDLCVSTHAPAGTWAQITTPTVASRVDDEASWSRSADGRSRGFVTSGASARWPLRIRHAVGRSGPPSSSAHRSTKSTLVDSTMQTVARSSLGSTTGWQAD